MSLEQAIVHDDSWEGPEAGPEPVPGRGLVRTDLLSAGLERLAGFADRLRDFEAVLDEIAELGGPVAKKQTDLLKTRLQAIDPSVTMIGQVKAGKTSLTNAMIARPDLLPADVNPWTSVVTSLHMNAPMLPGAPVAKFSFFDAGEWDRLMSDGGRLGELAQRSGADDELEKVRQQIVAMREKTRERLGRKFELLLGQSHDYGYLDEELVQRYVCMGDDFEDEDAGPNAGPNQQGRFADITKSAELYFERPEIPMPLCIRDTPGVNDTFMMREQITINSLRDSHICVVVLSAHQALTTMDMALIRLIANVKARDVIIYVNRIDELSDSGQQVPEIRASIVQTLKDNDGPKEVKIIFGSAYWANFALEGVGEDEGPALRVLADDSAAALTNWAEATLKADVDMSGKDRPELSETIWQLSGVPELYDAISERIIAGVAGDKLSQITKQALNIVQGIQASANVVELRLQGDVDVVLNDRADLLARLDRIAPDTLQALDGKLDVVMAAFAERLDRSGAQFLDRALASLMKHLEHYGEEKLWQYSPNGLRMLLRSSHQVLNRKYDAVCGEVFAQAATALEQTYMTAFNVPVDGFNIERPNVPAFPAPVAIGQTIALDLQSGWWSSWWKRKRGYRAFTAGFHDLIKAEIDPIIQEMKGEQLDLVRQAARVSLQDFVTQQRAILLDVTDKADVNQGDLDDLFGIKVQKQRKKSINAIVQKLETKTNLGTGRKR